GPRTFAGVQRWAASSRHPTFVRQYRIETAFAFGLTGVLFAIDFWGALLFVVLPQLYGARCILRINLIQHGRAGAGSEGRRSGTVVRRGFSRSRCRAGYRTIHRTRAGMHWSEVDEAHGREVARRMDPRLEAPSMIVYLLRGYVLGLGRGESLE